MTNNETLAINIETLTNLPISAVNAHCFQFRGGEYIVANADNSETYIFGVYGGELHMVKDYEGPGEQFRSPLDHAADAALGYGPYVEGPSL